jgi:hypothetical protein
VSLLTTCFGLSKVYDRTRVLSTTVRPPTTKVPRVRYYKNTKSTYFQKYCTTHSGLTVISNLIEAQRKQPAEHPVASLPPPSQPSQPSKLATLTHAHPAHQPQQQSAPLRCSQTTSKRAALVGGTPAHKLARLVWCNTPHIPNSISNNDPQHLFALHSHVVQPRAL